MISSSGWLAANFAAVPLVVLVFSRGDRSGASVYPAVWSLMLAARAEGVGTCLTTILGFYRSTEVFDLLGVPPDRGWILNAAVTAGYPTGRWGVARRRPVHEVVYAERWGEPVAWEVAEPMWAVPPGYGET